MSIIEDKEKSLPAGAAVTASSPGLRLVLNA